VLHAETWDNEIYTDVAGLASSIFSHAIDKRGAEAMRVFVDYWSGEGAWARTSPRLQAELLLHLPRVCADLRAVMFEHQTTLDLAAVSCPTLVIEGSDSPAVSRRLSELVAGAVPRASRRIVPGAGHLAPLTDPHVVDPMIGAHIVAAGRSGGSAACHAA
jgi:pimeloyl-ACP methyl ester carboxylesterase